MHLKMKTNTVPPIDVPLNRGHDDGLQLDVAIVGAGASGL
ncbi:MAG: hypothetical protein QOD51_2884, partial [Candidatus Eremiobacteraeota bacterium]|nr:hypothetical protein [Candidatus Eremiobacteraeota bacterium]